MASAYSLFREPLISLRHKLAAQAYVYGRQRTYYKLENVFVYSFLQGQKSDGHCKAGLAGEHSEVPMASSKILQIPL